MKIIRYLFHLLVILCLGSCEKLFISDDPANNAATNFEIFWTDFDRHYSFFELKNIDWDSVYLENRPVINEETSSTKLFEILKAITLNLKDGHVNLFTEFQTVRYDFISGFKLNHHTHAKNYLEPIRKLNRSISYANIDNEDLGYILIQSFGGSSDDFVAIDQVIEQFKNKKGIIIDVRSNGGGSDSNSNIIASRFTDQFYLYRWVKFRNGFNHNDFSEWIPREIGPEGPFQFTKSVAVLTNRGCFSSTEDFITAMNTLPHVTLVGDTTGGGSGNPITRELPNGWTFRFSNWVMVDKDFNNYEGIGIFPDLPVWISETDSIAGRDTILETAIELLK